MRDILRSLAILLLPLCLCAGGRTLDWSDSHWLLAPPFRVAEGLGPAGGNALLFETNAPPAYFVPSYFTDVRHNARYRASARVRTENLRGARAMLCLEWYDAGNRYLGGVYSQGVGGTTGGWCELFASASCLPTNSVKLQVSAYVSKGGIGKALFGAVKLEEFGIPPIAGVYSDRYRNRAKKGPITFFADVTPSNLKPTFAFDLPFAGGRKEVAADCVSNNWASVRVDAENLATGSVVCRMRGKDGVTLAERRLEFVHGEEVLAKGVSIDRHRRLMVDGKPFFPIGMYWSGVGEGDLKLYANGPFNCLMPYSRLSKAQLDLCARYGQKAMYNLKDYYAFHMRGREGITNETQATEAAGRIIAEFKDHPALLGWYLNDEIGTEHIDVLTARQRQLETLDPNHPTWTMLYQVQQMRDYLPAFDICGSDPYPFEDKNFEHPYFWPKMQREGTFGARPVWQAVKAHDHSAYFNSRERERILKEPVPTQQEIRNMAWQALCAGANGVFFYSLFDLKKMDWKSPFKRRFAEIREIAEELRRLERFFLSTEQPQEVRLVEGNDRQIACNSWRCGNENLLVVVNLTWKPVQGRIMFGKRAFPVNLPPMGISVKTEKLDISRPL